MGDVTIRNLDDRIIKRLKARAIVRSIVLPAFISAFVESTALRERAFAFATRWKHPVHDCFYAAYAEAVSAPFVTADEKLLRRLNTRGSSVRGVSPTRIRDLASR
jgi:predicted nucleic acid-binding protein